MGGEEGLGVTTGQPNLYKQDLSKLDVTKLTALSREVISRQATINIGTIGHVAHGKSTIVKAISGVQTVRFKNELERNITIKLEARAAENGSAERAEVPGDTCNMTSARQKKRPISPGCIQPSAKQSRLDELTLCQEHSTSSRLCDYLPQHDSNNSDTIDCTVSKDEHSEKAEEKNAPTSSIEKNPESVGNTDDITQTATERLSYEKEVTESGFIKSDDSTMTSSTLILEHIKLKELRVNLEDISKLQVSLTSNNMEKTPQYEVEQILGKKKVNDTVHYLIKWRGWDSSSNTWEPMKNLTNCSELLKEFEVERSLLVDKFKKEADFHPSIADIEKHMNIVMKSKKPLEDIGYAEDILYKNIRTFLKQGALSSPKLQKKIKQGLMHLLLKNSRKEQLESLQEWQNEMNVITKERPLIRVENNIDLEGPPPDFFYVDDYLPGSDVIIPEEPPIGCECARCAPKSDCCFSQAGGHFTYTATGRIRVPPGTPIYECNKRCTCSDECQNRVVQRGTNVKLCVFRTSNGRGWGVKTLRVIKKGTFVTQYVGEVITNEEAEKRGKEYDTAGRTYLFDLDYNETEGQCPYTVDAATYGNISHFINHSCDPNLAVYAVWIDCLDPNLPKLALFARRDIKQHEEITFDYMCQSSKACEKKKLESTSSATPMENGTNSCGVASTQLRQRLELPPETVNHGSISNRTRCKCGAKACRQYLF